MLGPPAAMTGPRRRPPGGSGRAGRACGRPPRRRSPPQTPPRRPGSTPRGQPRADDHRRSACVRVHRKSGRDESASGSSVEAMALSVVDPTTIDRPQWPLPLLLTLSAGVCLSVTTELLPTGVLPAMSRELGVTEGTLGLLVTAYALMVALFAAPLAMATARFPRRTLLVATLLGYSASNLVMVVSTVYPSGTGGPARRRRHARAVLGHARRLRRPYRRAGPGRTRADHHLGRRRRGHAARGAGRHGDGHGDRMARCVRGAHRARAGGHGRGLADAAQPGRSRRRPGSDAVGAAHARADRVGRPRPRR